MLYTVHRSCASHARVSSSAQQETTIILFENRKMKGGVIAAGCAGFNYRDPTHSASSFSNEVLTKGTCRYPSEGYRYPSSGNSHRCSETGFRSNSSRATVELFLNAFTGALTGIVHTTITGHTLFRVVIV